MEQKQVIDQQLCYGCGLCIEICPLGIFYLDRENKRPLISVNSDRSDCCMTCGHCMAVCPKAAIRVDGLSYSQDFFELPKEEIDVQAFFNFLDSRRSVRAFRDKTVPREILEKIVLAITSAPMGYTPSKVEITVVSERAVLEQALPELIRTYEMLGKMWRFPPGRALFRHRLPVETFIALDEHVLPSMEYRLPEMRAGLNDSITRGAPAMLLFHAKRQSGNHTEDAFIALTYGLLAAHALGLGACALGLVPRAVERSDPLRKLFQIPAENEVLASMVIGYPKYRFERGIRRDLADVNWI